MGMRGGFVAEGGDGTVNRLLWMVRFNGFGTLYVMDVAASPVG